MWRYAGLLERCLQSASGKQAALSRTVTFWIFISACLVIRVNSERVLLENDRDYLLVKITYLATILRIREAFLPTFWAHPSKSLDAIFNVVCRANSADCCAKPGHDQNFFHAGDDDVP